MMPTDTDGGLLMVSGSVRPTASVVWPIFIPALGAGVGTVRPAASILRRVNMRVWSVATTLAGKRSFWPGTDTSMVAGLLAKLKALETM